MSFSSVARQPRLAVQVNGALLLGAAEATVRSNNHFAADRFSAQIALGTDTFFDAAFWASEQAILVTVGMSLDGGGSVANLIEGLVDQIDIDVHRGVVRVEGRDMTASLIEARTQETFSSRTSSEIAKLLAARHGLAADVTPTRTLVGRYYSNEHDSITLDQFSHATTEWDLLVFLARQEQFDVYVRGRTLSFNPVKQSSTAVSVITPADVIDLRVERSLTLARDIEVTVKSWNSHQQRAFTQTATAMGQNGRQGGAAAATPSRYVYVVPNLTTDKALSLAQQRLAELTRHERVISLLMPGDLTTAPRDVVLLQGTGTAFDVAYHVDSVDRRLSPHDGFVQQVTAKNIAPSGQTTPPADAVGSVTG